MQILRRIMLACVAATFLTPVLLHAYDNESQLRARQALEDKMKELDTQQSVTSAPPPAVAQPAPKKAKKQKPAKASKSAKPAKQAPEAEKPASSDILVTPGQPAQEVRPAETAPSPAPVVTAPATAQPAPGAAPTYSAPQTTSSAETEETEKLRDAMREKMLREQQNRSATTNAPSQVNQPWAQPYNSQEHNPPQQQHVSRSSQPSKPQPGPSLPPLQAPPARLSAAKQQKLDQLLQLYRSDQITPQEYHDQRAKILAEP